MERDLIPPYCRAWERKRAHKRPAPDHLGGDILHVIAPAAPPPRPPGDLTAVVRQWHTAQSIQSAHAAQVAHAARAFEGVRA
ncbi:hypothetical protein KGD83_01760 [Nocardiopsis akebiae]|uniref:Uncharacterized protein n=1 Tax=Nocardiopsis akebiae TaxID=2831968 RepID=A0ABX8CG13_9ACTN|nr:hypothetical protein KGD83_01760 [Nocardiopsis akebiae]